MPRHPAASTRAASVRTAVLARATVLAPALLLLTWAPPVAAQTPLRTPDLPGPGVGAPGVLHLDALHRFDTDDASLGLTTLSASYGIGGYALAGVTWAGGDEAGDPDLDQWEWMVRFSPFTSAAGAPLDLGLTAAWNDGFGSVDGELEVGLPVEPERFHLLGTVRLLGDAFGSEDSRWFLGAGAVLRLHERVSLEGDLVSAADPLEEEDVAWGVAASLLVPRTPATLALEVTDTRAPTLHSSSRGAGGTRWGFRLHVPVPLRRLLGGEAESRVGSRRAGEADLVGSDTVTVAVEDGGFSPSRIQVGPGTYVRWTNRGTGIHSVTAADGSWESPLLAPGESFGRVFTEGGSYPYQCRLHPEDTGEVVVGSGA